MLGSFNCFLDKRFLLKEVRLKPENPFIAAIIGFASLLAFASKVCLPQSMFREHCLDAFGHIWVLIIVW